MNNNEKIARSKSNVAIQVLLSAIAGVLGYLLLFRPDIQVVTVCKVLCFALIVVGLISILSFFLSEDYKRIDRFGFTAGVLLILLGCIGLIRMNDLTTSFEIFAGVMALILGVLTLQGTVQMKALNYSIWILNLIFSIVSLAGAFIVLSKIEKITGLVAGFFSWVLIVNGGACILSLILTTICILLARRRAAKAAKAQAEAAASQDYWNTDQPKPADTVYETPKPQPAPEWQQPQPAPQWQQAQPEQTQWVNPPQQDQWQQPQPDQTQWVNPPQQNQWQPEHSPQPEFTQTPSPDLTFDSTSGESGVHIPTDDVTAAGGATDGTIPQ